MIGLGKIRYMIAQYINEIRQSNPVQGAGSATAA
jgi:hypothetical protein